jgi:glycosyltransferase involved in cell wall biosynthesis
MDAVELISNLYEDSRLMEYKSRISKEFAKEFTWEKTVQQFEEAIK